MATRVQYSRNDSSNLVNWVATKHPENTKRHGNDIWKELVEDPRTLKERVIEPIHLKDALHESPCLMEIDVQRAQFLQDAQPWNSRHSWQSWRDHYVKNSKHYDILITKRVNQDNNARPAQSNADGDNATAAPVQNGGSSRKTQATTSKRAGPSKRTVPSSQATLLSSLPSQAPSNGVEDAQDVEHLANYFATKAVNEDIRLRATTYQDMRDDEEVDWVQKRSGFQWRELYQNHKEEVDKRAKELGYRETASESPTVDPVIRLRKRRRERSEHAEEGDGASTGTKKRRIEQSDGKTQPEARIATRSARASAHDGSKPGSSRREPVVIAPGTPPTSQPETQEDASRPRQLKPVEYVEASNHLPSPVSPASSPINRLPNGKPLDSSQVPETVVSPPPLDHRPGRKSIGNLISSALSAYTTFGASMYGVQGTPVMERRRPPKEPQQSKEDQTLQVQATTTPTIEGKKTAGGIFPHILPSLTPLLRSKAASQKSTAFPLPTTATARGRDVNGKRLDGDESVRVTSAEEEEVERDLVNGDASLPAATRKASQQMLTPLNVSDATARRYADRISQGGNDVAVDEEEDDEGPSPMPNMGSDRHSSFSVSHGADDDLPEPEVEIQEQDFVEPLEPDAQDEAEDHGENVIPKREPRYFVPKKHPRPPSASPLFASSEPDVSPNSEADKSAAIHYPLTTKNTAFGTFRDRSPRQSLEGALGSKEKNRSRTTIGVEDGSGDEEEEQDVIHISDDEVNKENQPADFVLDTPDVLPRPLNLNRASLPATGALDKFVKNGFSDAIQAFRNDRVNRILAPLPGRKSGNDPFLDSASHRHGEGKLALHYTAPNVSRHTEAKYMSIEEPSPTLQRAERVKKDERRHSVDDTKHAAGEEVGSSKKKQQGRVRFDGAAIDRDRRKTTGGIGVTFGNSKGESTRFSDMFGAQDPEIQATRARMGIPPQDEAPAEVIDLDSDADEEDESPLARYSMREAPSTDITSSAARVNSMLHSRRSSNRNSPPPPPGIPVPIVISSSPFPKFSPITNNMATKASARRVSTKQMGAAAWSPFRFGEQSNIGAQDSRGSRASTVSSDKGMDLDELVEEIPSIDFRDQQKDADWVAAARGRLSVSSKRLSTARRNAPLPSADDVVVYSSSPSRQPSKTRSRSRSKVKPAVRNPTDPPPISQDDQETIIRYLVEQSVIKEGDDVDLETLRDGLAELFLTMGSTNGFDSSVPRNVWMQCGSLAKTGVIIQAMTDAANDAGLKQLKLQQKKEMEGRDEWLRKSVDGRRVSGVSSLPRDASMRMEEDEEEEDGDSAAAERTRLRARRSMDKRYSKPPTHIPAEVIEPLFHQ